MAGGTHTDFVPDAVIDRFALIGPVIDRGPFANHADWDLTTATAVAMGIPGTETIGAVSLPSAP